MPNEIGAPMTPPVIPAQRSPFSASAPSGDLRLEPAPSPADQAATRRYLSSGPNNEMITSSLVPSSSRITRMAVLSRSREAGLALT